MGFSRDFWDDGGCSFVLPKRVHALGGGDLGVLGLQRTYNPKTFPH